MNVETIYLAGGCFWGMQDLIRRQAGIVSTRVGYMGGTLPNATYLQLKHQPSGHAETVEVCYDPACISQWAVLSLFFQIHDPTTPNRQGNDKGESYRSVIFYTNEKQRDTAKKAIAVLNTSGLWPGLASTEVLPAGDFWLAEPEHQDYLEHYPNGYTCHWVRPEWRLPIPPGEDK